MNRLKSHPRHSRREILKSSALGLLPVAIPFADYGLHDQQPMTANGGQIPTRSLGWIRMAATISQQVQTSNLRMSTILKVESPGPAPSQAWAPTIKGIASRLAVPQLTME